LLGGDDEESPVHHAPPESSLTSLHPHECLYIFCLNSKRQPACHPGSHTVLSLHGTRQTPHPPQSPCPPYSTLQMTAESRWKEKFITRPHFPPTAIPTQTFTIIILAVNAAVDIPLYTVDDDMEPGTSFAFADPYSYLRNQPTKTVRDGRLLANLSIMGSALKNRS
jgi:hypothetical protein